MHEHWCILTAWIAWDLADQVTVWCSGPDLSHLAAKKWYWFIMYFCKTSALLFCMCLLECWARVKPSFVTGARTSVTKLSSAHIQYSNAPSLLCKALQWDLMQKQVFAKLYALLWFWLLPSNLSMICNGASNCAPTPVL